MTTAHYIRWWRSRHPGYDAEKCRLYRRRKKQQHMSSELGGGGGALAFSRCPECGEVYTKFPFFLKHMARKHGYFKNSISGTGGGEKSGRNVKRLV